MAVASCSTPDHLDQVLDQSPSLSEICEHSRTAKWYELGIQLQIDAVDLDNIRSDPAVTDKLSSMYNLWLNKRAETATRKELLIALQTEHVGQNRVAMEYKEYLIREMDLILSHSFPEKKPCSITNMPTCPSLPEEVLIKHNVELCELLAIKDIKESLVTNLIAIGLLSEESAHKITDGNGLLQEISIAIQHDCCLFGDFLTEIRKYKCLQEMASKLEKSFMSLVQANLTSISNSQTNFQQPSFGSTDNESLMTIKGLMEVKVADKASTLELKFHQWLLEVRKSIENVDANEIKFYLSLLLNGSPELTNLYFEKVNTPNLSVGSDTILFLMSQGLLSFWNYGALQYIVKSLLQQDANVVTMMEEYDRDYHTFCDTLLQLQKAFVKDSVRKSRPKPPASLLHFCFKMKDPWPTKSVQQWRDKYSGMFPWSQRTVMTNITPGCITMTYVALPCVTPAVLRDLIDPIILEELALIGITVSLQLPENKTDVIEMKTSIGSIGSSIEDTIALEVARRLRDLGDSISVEIETNLDAILKQIIHEQSIWEIGYSQFQFACWKILNSSQNILKSGWEQMSVVYMVTNRLVSEIQSQKGESDSLREAQIKGYAGNFMRDSGIQEWVEQQGGMDHVISGTINPNGPKKVDIKESEV